MWVNLDINFNYMECHKRSLTQFRFYGQICGTWYVQRLPLIMADTSELSQGESILARIDLCIYRLITISFLCERHMIVKI